MLLELLLTICLTPFRLHTNGPSLRFCSISLPGTPHNHGLSRRDPFELMERKPKTPTSAMP